MWIDILSVFSRSSRAKYLSFFPLSPWLSRSTHQVIEKRRIKKDKPKPQPKKIRKKKEKPPALPAPPAPPRRPPAARNVPAAASKKVDPPKAKWTATPEPTEPPKKKNVEEPKSELPPPKSPPKPAVEEVDEPPPAEDDSEKVKKFEFEDVPHVLDKETKYKCYMWYARLGQPNRETMVKRIQNLIDRGECDIKIKDVLALPWMRGGFCLRVSAMNELFLNPEEATVK